MTARSLLLTSKITVPARGRLQIARPRLDGVLDSPARGSVTSVVAPAGFGKTVLAVRWAARLSAAGTAVAWLSLDAADDHPDRFWSYLVAALRQVDPLVAAAGAGPTDAAWTALHNVLAERSTPLVLIVDDYQVITDARIHDALAFLLQRPSAAVHLVVLSRSDPPFLTARAKVVSGVAELRAADLAFDEAESARYLAVQRLPPAVPVPADLLVRVAGWPAGLRLLALWVKACGTSRTAVPFEADGGALAQYLIVDVLGQLPDELQRFLLLTALLPRLTGPLCDQVTGGRDGARHLRELEAAGLFVDPLDAAGDWFRYHDLFSEVLARELRHRHPELVRPAHRVASRWFAGAGFVGDSIEHAAKAQDWSEVRRLLLDETLALGGDHPPALLDEWLRLLPEQLLTTPFFLVLDGYLRGQEGRLPEATTALTRALSVPPAGVDGDLPEVAALGHAIRASIFRLEVDLAGARRAARRVDVELERVGARDSRIGQLAVTIARCAVAGALLWTGEHEASARLLTRVEQGAPPGLRRMHANRLSLQALVLVDRGRLQDAERTADQALDLARSVGCEELFQSTPAHLALAQISLARGDTAAATEQLEELATRTEELADRGPRTIIAVLRAQLAEHAGDLAQGVAELRHERATWSSHPSSPALRAAVLEQETRLYLRGHDLRSARAAVDELVDLGAGHPVVVVARDSARARLLLAEGDGAAALTAFTAAARGALASALPGRTIDNHLGACITSQQLGQQEGARDWLRQALVLAEAEAVAWPFLRHAATLRPLLLSLELDDGAGRRTLRVRLLNDLHVPVEVFPRQVRRTRSTVVLSDRELTVLQLLSGSLGNTDIAHALSISPNTLKTHIRHIFTKLDVGSRAGAVRRARAVDLL